MESLGYQIWEEKNRDKIYNSAPAKIITIPENIVKWLEKQDGANLSVNFNSVSANGGYSHIVRWYIEISMLTRTCNRCGYDSLWNPDDSNSKCLRHTYEKPRYDVVFSWMPTRFQWSLEEAFDKWLKEQPKEYWKPTKRMNFGVPETTKTADCRPYKEVRNCRE